MKVRITEWQQPEFAVRVQHQSSKPAEADFTIHGSGTIYLFEALTERATDWLRQHCPVGHDHQYLGDALAVEHRFVQNIVELAIGDGLTPSNPQ